MRTIRIFTDGSVDVKSGIGYGACLILEDSGEITEELHRRISVKRFENTSSTRLELETLLWAISKVAETNCRIDIYTDSNTIINLPKRRKRFEERNYRSNKNRLLTNHDLYKAFFKQTGQIDYRLNKVEGHQPKHQKDAVSRIFTLVDKASRKALRNELKQNSL